MESYYVQQRVEKSQYCISFLEFDGNSYSDMSSLVSLNALCSSSLISFLEASLKENVFNVKITNLLIKIRFKVVSLAY